MSGYRAPVRDMMFALTDIAGLREVAALPGYQDATPDIVSAVLVEASKLGAEVLAPLNRAGDTSGCCVADRAVKTPPGFADAYRAFAGGGWQGLPFDPAQGGQGLPELVSTAVNEIWQSANMAFALCPMLTEAAIVAIERHGSDAIRKTYLPKLISGQWSGTMNLTEPQAGSDLAAVKTRAVPEGDHYRLTGQKIFITWGDQDFTENIAHLVLARLPDAPAGIKGISLFLVPKFLVNDDGSSGARNDVYPASVEHKLGIHGSPTCVMIYGENGGAMGYLVGEPHGGIALMFTMMNHARVAVGIQGLSISERAYQQARAYALERVQGQAAGGKARASIIQHPDVRRMLMQMKAGAEAMRGLCYVAAASADHGHRASNDTARRFHESRFALLTPIVKGWCTELAQEITSLGVQVHGGMGYVEETGAAQHFRDARITTIYEGTTGIQANDLIGRKLLRDNGAALAQLVVEMRATQQQLRDSGAAGLTDIGAALGRGIDALEQTAAWVLAHQRDDAALPGAVAVNFLMGAGTVGGGWVMGRAALAARDRSGGGKDDQDFSAAKRVTALFYAEHYLPRAAAFLEAVRAGSGSIMSLRPEQF